MGTLRRREMGIVRMSDPRLDNLLLVSDARRSIHWKNRLLHRPFPLRHAHSVADTR